MSDRAQLEEEVVQAERHVDYALKNATGVQDRENLSLAKQALEQVANPPKAAVEYTQAEAEEVLDGLVDCARLDETRTAYRKTYLALAIAIGGKEKISHHLPEKLD